MRKVVTPSNGIEIPPVALKSTKSLTITTKPKEEKAEEAAPEARSVQATGQNGAKIADLPYAKLNGNEKRLVDFARTQGVGAVVTIPQMCTEVYGDLPKEQASITVRNALRRLMRSDWFAKVKRGAFSLTDIAAARF